MNRLEIMKQSRENLANGWCQRDFGQDARGLSVPIIDIRQAVKVCMKGAIYKASATSSAEEAVLSLVMKHCQLKDPKYDTIGGFNDSADRTQEECLEVFDAAIRELEEQLRNNNPNNKYR